MSGCARLVAHRRDFAHHQHHLKHHVNQVGHPSQDLGRRSSHPQPSCKPSESFKVEMANKYEKIFANLVLQKVDLSEISINVDYTDLLKRSALGYLLIIPNAAFVIFDMYVVVDKFIVL